jgi:uncharacterized RDD family membrane protein YckC
MATPFEDRTTVATAEGVELELALAGVASRVIASLLDWLVKGVLIGALAIALLAIGGVGVAIFVIASFAVVFAYDICFETLAAGRTPGKRRCGLRVVTIHGGQVDLLTSSTRNLARLVDGLPLLYIPSLACIPFTRLNQRPGDLAAGTLVVRDARPLAPLASTTTTTIAEANPDWDVSAITEAELGAVRRFLERRETLTPTARERLALRLATALREKVGGASESDPEDFLQALVAAKAQRR